MTFFLLKNEVYLAKQIANNEMGWKYSTQSGAAKGRDHLGDVGLDERTTLL
jgi:hypothetical protein